MSKIFAALTYCIYAALILGLLCADTLKLNVKHWNLPQI